MYKNVASNPLKWSIAGLLVLWLPS
jgi:hypothetical protein